MLEPPPPRGTGGPVKLEMAQELRREPAPGAASVSAASDPLAPITPRNVEGHVTARQGVHSMACLRMFPKLSAGVAFSLSLLFFVGCAGPESDKKQVRDEPQKDLGVTPKPADPKVKKVQNVAVLTPVDTLTVE